MRIGIGTYTYTWAIGVAGSLPAYPMDAKKLIDKAAEHEVACVQFADNIALADLGKPALTEIKAYAKIKGIAIEVGGRGLTEENLDRYIDLASFFNSPLLRMVIDQGEYKPTNDITIGIIRNALGNLASKGVVLALENHDRLPASAFRRIIVEVDSLYAGICLDCVNSMGIGEGLETVVSNLAPYTVNLHVKDFIVKRISHMMGFVVEGVPAGKGFLNLPNLLKALEPFGKCQSAILELWTPPEDNLSRTIEKEEAWAKESIVYMKKTILQS